MEGSGNHPNHGRLVILWEAWSSSRQWEHCGIDLAFPIVLEQRTHNQPAVVLPTRTGSRNSPRASPHNCAWLRLLLLDRQTVLVLTILLPRWLKRHNLHLHSAQSSWQGCRPPSATWHTRPSCAVPNREPWLQTPLYSLVRWKVNYQACVQEARDRTLRPAPLHLLY